MKVNLTEEQKLEQLQDETIALIKNKGNKKMKKEKKAPRTFTLIQIIKTVVMIAALLGLGAFAGIVIDRAISDMINRQVKEQTAEQVKVFTSAVEE